MGYTLPVIKEDFIFMKEWTLVAESLLEEKKLKHHPIRMMDRGLEGIWKGLQMIHNGQVSGEKLVYIVGSL